MRTICFILPKLYQPRYLKRIREAKEKNYNVRVLYFNRFNYEEKNLDEFQNIDTNKIANIDNNFKLSRIIAYFKLMVFLIKNKKKYSDSIIYIFTFDLLVILNTVLSFKKIIYEIGDIIYLKYNPVIRNLFTWIEIKMMNRCDKIVLTSSGFNRYYRRKGYNKRNIKIIPNKVPKNIVDKYQPKKTFRVSDDKIRIGYIGIFRYKKYLFEFIHEVGNRENLEMIFYGYSNFLSELEDLIFNYNNVKYIGKYNTKDLPDIYGSIDISYCIYLNGLNEKVAEPNKFYESIFFKKPILCQKDTQTARKVNKLNSGFAIDISKERDIRTFLENLNHEKIERKIISINKIPVEYSYCVEEVF